LMLLPYSRLSVLAKFYMPFHGSKIYGGHS